MTKVSTEICHQKYFSFILVPLVFIYPAQGGLDYLEFILIFLYFFWFSYTIYGVINRLQYTTYLS